VLAVVGVTHPSDLTAQSAEYWRNLHIAILAVFPLLGFAPWLVVRGRNAVVSWVAGILGFLFAAFYTALDVLAGIGAGGLEFDGHGDVVGTVFRLGNNLGDVGSYAFVAACVLAAGVCVRWFGIRSLIGGVMVIAGSLLFLERHIYFPVGVAGQLLLAAGWVALLVARDRSTSTAA
jgi:hypothetical protein